MILNNFYQYLLQLYKPAEDYVLFSGPTQFTLNGIYNTSYQIVWDGAVYYSTDGKKYKSWDKSEITARLDSTDNLYKIYLQGKGNTYFKGSGWYAMKMTGSDVSISGSLAALLDAETVSRGETPSTSATRCFAFCFRELNTIVSLRDLKLPLTADGRDCYYGTFCDCHNLVYPPRILPAPDIKANGYQEIFLNDTSLIEAPIMLATQTANGGHGCYGMFRGCTSLETPPAILFNSGTSDNQNMFYGCTSLNRLPRIIQARNYDTAFSGCSNIKVSETQDSTYQYPFTLPSGGSYNNMFQNTGGTFTGTPVAGTTYYTDHPLVEAYMPIQFSSANSFTIAHNTSTKTWDGTIEYSTDFQNWTTWDGTSTLTAASDGESYKLYFRGTDNTYITGNNTTYKWVITGSGVSISGNTNTIFDYSKNMSGTSFTIANYALKDWLSGQTALTDASGLIIPRIVNYCCHQMFLGCTNLINSPFLPSTTLGTNCYQNMFQDCTSLVEAPELPATTLTGASACYNGMFRGCTSLVNAPKLPATTVVNTCYEFMFRGCTSLVNAPKLPATTVENGCYHGMFYGCTSLVKAPELPATTLNYSWTGNYDQMFYGCTSLVEAPKLPATTIKANCYKEMFRGCTSLVKAPELPATTAPSYCYKGMFRDCTSLVTGPELPATTVGTYCYQEMFYGCTSLTTITTELPATTLEQTCYHSMFYGCNEITTAPALPAVTIPYNAYYGMFDGCSNLVVVPELGATTVGNNFSLGNMFNNCSKVKASESNTGEYVNTWFVCDPDSPEYAYSSMLVGTGGDFKGTPQPGVTYYTSNVINHS